jgi:signal transduction histidine kinase
MSAAIVTAAELRTIDLFDGLDDAQLAGWVAVAESFEAAPGEVIEEQGVTSRGLVLLLEGTARTLLVVEGRSEPMGHQRAPTWIGAIAALTEGSLGVRMEAETTCRVALVPTAPFIELTLATPPVHQRIMRQIRPVMSRITATEQSRERLASLGTMAAGLAHELNNPAAAAKRSAAQLVEALDVVGATLGAFVEAGIERADAEQLVHLQRAALAAAEQRTALDALDAADAEDAMLERLEGLGVHEPWRIAEPLAAAGLDAAWLARVAELAGTATDQALSWVAASLTARHLAAELRDSAERMSALVGAVKSYAYMDRGALVQADVHEGIETTLTMLAHKLKHTEIAVVRSYDRDLPPLTLRGSELNQVWTNLLDNAIDALGERGTITIATRRDGPCVVVDVADDGPGIPPSARAHVLDPFFTTKAVGRGTGLGLDTVRRIVEDRHTGSLSFDTGDAGTTFHVRLPLEQTTA